MPSSCRRTPLTRLQLTATAVTFRSEKARSGRAVICTTCTKKHTHRGIGSRKIKALAEELGMHCFSSPFDASAVDLSGRNGCSSIQSRVVRDRRYPVAGKDRINGQAGHCVDGNGFFGRGVRRCRYSAYRLVHPQIALLKCVSAYPAPPEAMNLRTIPHLAEAFSVPAGLSDHTLGITVPVTSVALGATIIEKHFTLSRDIPGPDSQFSLEPDEFHAMVEAVRTAEKSLGQVHYGVGESEQKSRAFRRSLFVVEDVKKGEQLTAENVRSIRPGHGMAPRHLPEVIGRIAGTDIPRGTPLDWRDVA